MKPILFSTPMVEAILEDRKTMTRRVIKGTALNWLEGGVFTPKFVADPENYLTKYNAGDILWVRETWSIQECEKCRAGIPALGGECKCEYVYRTNYGTTEDDSFPPSMFKWRPSIFMPKDAARIFLRVKGTRAEQLWDITEEDALKEGFRPGDQWAGPNSSRSGTARQSFMWYWDSLNRRRDYPWDLNPWVWVYTFERCEKPGGTK